MSETSVLIVTYNSAAFIESCLNSLQQQTYQDFELIVVDNASTDDSLNCTARQLPAFSSARLISLTVNRGFAAGNNEALRQASGAYIALLNPDAEASPQWLQSLVTAMKEHPDAGSCASRLLVHGAGIIDSAGDGCITTGAGYKRGETEPADRYCEAGYVFGACGGAALFRRAMLEEIGFFDDDFFLIHEDTDLNFRAQLAGWKCFYAPDAVVEHKVRSTIGAGSDTAVYYSLRNALFVLAKNMPAQLFLRYAFQQLVQQAGLFLFVSIRDRQFGVWRRAYRDFFRALPALRQKRRTVMQRKTVDHEIIAALLTPLWNHQRICRTFRADWQRLFHNRGN